MSIPTLAEFEDAAAYLDGVITRTPIDESQYLSALLGVPVPKLLATRGYGAEVVLEGATVETPLRLAAEFAQRTGAVLILSLIHI